MTTVPPSRFGALLKEHRRAAGLSQATLAEQARLSTRGLQDLERGVSQTPRRETVALLATALGLSPPDRAALEEALRRPPRPPPPRRPVVPSAAPSAGALVPLVGRARELALLDQFLAAPPATEGSAPVLLLAGEPGIGKTSLLQVAAQQAIARGWSVLAGGCHRGGGQEPYAPVVEALERFILGAGPASQRAALAGCAWLAPLLPEVAGMLEPLPTHRLSGTLALEQERRLIHAAVARLLTNSAGPSGTLLVLDDLQWAGPDAIDLLAALVRSGVAPLRLLGAYRDTEVGPADPLGLFLADLAQARLGRRQEISPLGPEEAAALLDALLVGMAPPDRGLIARAVQRAGGVPFFLVSYREALQQGSAKGVPWDLAQAIGQRVALLPAAGQEVLGAASVVGRRAPHTLLAAVTEQAEEALLAGLEAACQARLLREDGDDAYVFTHDVIYEVVEAGVGVARRAMLHRKVAEALEGGPGGAPPEQMAYHYAGAGNQERAAHYYEQAGDRAWELRAHGAAEGHYRAALERLERLAHAPDAPRVCEKLGEVLHQVGRYDAALEVLGRAAEAYGAVGDLEGQARVAATMGLVHRFRGTAVAGIAQITAMLERLERHSASPPSLATLNLVLGWLLFTAGHQYDASLAASERAAALARTSGDDRTLALAEEHRINILQMLGRLNDALRVGQEVLPLAERVGDLTCLVGAHSDVAYIHALRGDFASSRRSLDRALAWAEQLGNPTLLAFILAVRSWIAVLTGAWTEARADLDRAASVSSQTDRSWYTTYLPIFQARLSLVEGAWKATSGAVQEALAQAGVSGDLQALRWAATALAELEILEGRPEAARARLVPLLDRPGLQECDVTTFLPVLAWAQLELGQLDEAADTVEQAFGRAGPEEIRLVLVEALRVRALLALRREQWDEAAGSLAEGLALARAMPYPYAEARLLRLSAEMHRARGRRARARALFRGIGAAQSPWRARGGRAGGARPCRAVAKPARPVGPHHPDRRAVAADPAPAPAPCRDRAAARRRPAGPRCHPLQAGDRVRVGCRAGRAGGWGDRVSTAAPVAGQRDLGADMSDPAGGALREACRERAGTCHVGPTRASPGVATPPGFETPSFAMTRGSASWCCPGRPGVQ